MFHVEQINKSRKMFYVEQSRGEQKRALWPFETVEKVAAPLFREGLHARWASIPCGKVGPSCARSVISDAHVAGNDGLKLITSPAGAGTTWRRAFSTS